MAPSTVTLGDLIEVPPIRTVIQLADLDNPSAREEILERFVFTQEIRAFFGRWLGSLGADHGLGAFLKGHYGSGKSHALAFLTRLLQHDPQALHTLGEAVPAGGLEARGWVVVSLPLLGFPATARLEEVVMEAVERALAEAGTPVSLAESSRLLATFRDLILPRYAERLAGFDELGDEEALERARAFLAELPDNPLRLTYDRRQVFASLESALAGRGLVLLLDELSEFLKSKPDDRSFNEDIRYLQFLGEWAQHMPLWIVASVQQSLEELGYREQDGVNRIKERYPLRFSLSARHVHDLIEGRLIRRRPGSQKVVDGLWKDLDAAFPGLVGREEFGRIYPLHPATLELLERLMPLFSRHRGVVDFVHSWLAGNPLKGIPGMLQASPDRLLTADAIYDHFRERIQETPELSSYDRVAYTYLEKDVPRIFEADKDRDLAMRLVKILLLAEISPSEMERTPEALARMAARRVSRLSAKVNRDYVAETVLAPLAERSCYVSRVGEEYRIDLEANLAQVLGGRIRERRRHARADWGEALGLVNRPCLPLADFVGRPAVDAQVKWQNTRRAGRLQLADLEHLAYDEFLRLLNLLAHGREVFLVLLGLPGNRLDAARGLLEHAREATLGEAVLFWLPEPPGPELCDRALDWKAHRLVADELRQEGEHEALRTLTDRIGELERSLEEELAELYYGGRLLHLRGDESPPREVRGWDRALVRLVGPRLEAAFPLHQQVAPRADCLNATNLKKLWSEFLEPGGASERELPRGVEELLEPLGLIRRDVADVRLEADPGSNRLLAQITDRLLPTQPVPFEELSLSLRKGPYGLPFPSYCLLVAALVQAGRVTPFAGGRATALSSLEPLLRYRVEALGPARRLDPATAGRLQRIDWLWRAEEIQPFTPAHQRELWESAREQLAELEGQAQSVDRLVKSAGELRSGQALPLESLARQALEVRATLAEVGLPKGSTPGLRKLAGSRAWERGEAVSAVRAWSRFGERHLRRYQELCSRLEALGYEQLPQRLETLATSDDPCAAWEELETELGTVEADYRNSYLQAHADYYSAPAFGEAGALDKDPRWKALEALAGVLGLAFEPSPGELRRRKAELPRSCRRRVGEHLVLGVRCACGFEPGDAPPAPLGLQSEVEEALTGACRSLLGPQPTARLEEHLRSLREVGREELAGLVEEALGAAGEAARPTGLPGFWERVAPRLSLTLSQPAVVEALNRALTGNTLVVRRDPGRLLAALADRTLPQARLLQVFRQWLEGPDLPEDAWVRVSSEPSGSATAAWLARWLELHELEPTAAMRRHYDLEQPGPTRDHPETAEDELWEKNLLDEVVRRLDPVPACSRENLFPRVSRELCRRILRGAAGGGPRLASSAGCWDHLAVTLHACKALELIARPGFAAWSEAALEWARARHLNLGCALLTPDIEETLDGMLCDARKALEPEGLPLTEVPERLLGPRSDGRPLVVLLVDALRWDLYQLLRPLLEEELGIPAEEVLAVAPTPTLTRVGRGALLGAGEGDTPPGFDGRLLGRPLVLVRSADSREHRSRTLELLSDPPEALMLHLDFVDRRCHETRLEKWPLFSELLAEARVRLLPLLRALPPRCAMLLTADHGFRTADEAAGSAHGGASLEERMVPAATWLRG